MCGWGRLWGSVAHVQVLLSISLVVLSCRVFSCTVSLVYTVHVQLLMYRLSRLLLCPGLFAFVGVQSARTDAESRSICRGDALAGV